VRWPARIDRALRRLVVTPDLHRVHHSTLEHEANSNYGAVLTLWDQLFGTFRTRTSVPLDRMAIGLQQPRDVRTHQVLWLLHSPWLDLSTSPGDPAETPAVSKEPIT
jgi:sterol desaturase/sphingolipid hydroxylase (fatty acid hydroxylase superfamily)